MKSIQVVAGVVVQGGQVLIARRCAGQSLAGFWEFPGGKIEAGEDAAQALQRELFEELAIHVRVGSWLGTSQLCSEGRHITLLAYWAEWISGELQLTDHDRALWVSPSELPDHNLAPADRPFVAKIQSHFLNSL